MSVDAVMFVGLYTNSHHWLGDRLRYEFGPEHFELPAVFVISECSHCQSGKPHRYVHDGIPRDARLEVKLSFQYLWKNLATLIGIVYYIRGSSPGCSIWVGGDTSGVDLWTREFVHERITPWFLGTQGGLR